MRYPPRRLRGDQLSTLPSQSSPFQSEPSSGTEGARSDTFVPDSSLMRGRGMASKKREARSEGGVVKRGLGGEERAEERVGERKEREGVGSGLRGREGVTRGVSRSVGREKEGSDFRVGVERGRGRESGSGEPFIAAS